MPSTLARGHSPWERTRPKRDTGEKEPRKGASQGRGGEGGKGKRGEGQGQVGDEPNNPKNGNWEKVMGKRGERIRRREYGCP